MHYLPRTCCIHCVTPRGMTTLHTTYPYLTPLCSPSAPNTRLRMPPRSLSLFYLYTSSNTTSLAVSFIVLYLSLFRVYCNFDILFIYVSGFCRHLWFVMTMIMRYVMAYASSFLACGNTNLFKQPSDDAGDSHRSTLRMRSFLSVIFWYVLHAGL
jgi:hypothetical protein